MTTSLHLSKENFKFSSAHFLIFDNNSAEMLHGHNYQVNVDIEFKATDLNVADSSLVTGVVGYYVDFKDLKNYIKSQLDQWDEHVLLPELHTDMKYQLSTDHKNYEIHFRDRFYSLPKDETIWLKITNTSVEQLSQLLAKNFYTEFKKYNIESVRVTVEETRGQAASACLKDS